MYGTWEFPPEDPEGGCPAGWRMAPLVRSVVSKARKRTKDGGRVSNPFFDRVDDDVLLTAVLAYEAHEDAVHTHFDREWAEEQKRKR